MGRTRPINPGRPRACGGGPSLSRRRRSAWLPAAILSAAVLAGFGAPASSGAPDPAAILERAEEVRSPDLDYAVDFDLIVRDPNTVWKERTARYTLIAHGKDHSMIQLREPAQFHPGTLLIQNGLYWMLFPRTDKPIQLSSRNILNGDVSNGDLARGNLLRHYEVTLDGEEKVEGDACWILDLKRISHVALYPRIRYWVSKRKDHPVRMEYYGETGRLDRTVRYEEYTEGPIGLRAMRIVVDSGKRAGETTTMRFENLRLIDLAGLEFDIAGLISFRDAALKRLEVDGEQARPEDVIPLLRTATR